MAREVLMSIRVPIVCVLLALAPAAVIQAARVKQVHKVVALDASGRLSIDTHNGSVMVTTWNQPNVQIDARIEAEEGSDYPEDVEATNVLITGSGANVRVESDYTRVREHPLHWFGFGSQTMLPPVYYTISMPATARLKIENHNSKIRVTGLRGDVAIASHNGPVDVRDFSGAAEIETHNGEIRVAFSSFSKPSRLETHNASVDVRMPPASRFALKVDSHRSNVVSSDFVFASISGERASYRTTVNGGGPELTFVTHNGSLRLGKL
jgi:hypothetical protein